VYTQSSVFGDDVAVSDLLASVCTAVPCTSRTHTRRKRRISSESRESCISDVDSQSSAYGILCHYAAAVLPETLTVVFIT